MKTHPLSTYTRPFIANNGAIRDAENITVIEAREGDAEIIRGIVALLNEVPRESAWLIETARGTYWDGKKAGTEAFFVSNACDAVRFTRFEDAEIVRCWLLEQSHAHTLRSAEHVFIEALPSGRNEG